MDNSLKATIFRGGLPYEPDVAKLNVAFPVESLEHGRILEHAAVLATLGMEKRNDRYEAVLRSWRRDLQADHRIVLTYVRAPVAQQDGRVKNVSIGLRVCDDAEKLGHSQSKMKTGVRVIKKSFAVLGAVNEHKLTDEQRRRFDHSQRVMGALHATAQQAAKDIELPKRTPPPQRQLGDRPVA
jgi:hypothetical protein